MVFKRPLWRGGMLKKVLVLKAASALVDAVETKGWIMFQSTNLQGCAVRDVD
jgi:hypothetical protein